MKKALRFFSCLLIMCLMVSVLPVRTEKVSAATVSLSLKKVTFETGAKLRLVLRNASGKITWSSGNKKVVKVSSKGVVTAVGPGTARVTAKYNGKSYRCTFTVPKPELNYTAYELEIGGTVRLKLSGAEADSFKSGKKSVASVSSRGLVKAKKGGEAVITVTDVNGAAYECVITVKEPVPEHVHTLVHDARVEATCTTDGLTSGIHCETCGEIFDEQTVIPATGHSYNEEGYCTVCGEADPVMHHKHEYVTESTPATCTENGRTVKIYCATCGEVFVEPKDIPALGHEWVNGYCSRCGIAWYCDHKPVVVKEQPATCTKDGISEYIICELCGEYITIPSLIPLLGHDYGDTDHCRRCGADLSGHVHTWEILPAKAPTCTEPGLTQGQHCTTCGEWRVYQDFIQPTGQHDYDENGVCKVCQQKKP